MMREIKTNMINRMNGHDVEVEVRKEMLELFKYQ